ncbi:flagellar filament capping protein FliD [Paradesulfitobacterium ferrireducens]|uniref:flagellar filament capping protein FliD n=1 Tax=Paradesulfitobacterium ferrireducens TaxID=2816476 RepID=UPI001A90827E|nr:flagellar filament capping protein FliD [Paradesulfitobacterium ferrireducens]
MPIGSTSMSLPGLSGYDFSGIIDKMVQAYKLPENQLFDKQGRLQTKKTAWMDVNTSLLALDTAATALRSASTWTATQTVSSNTSILSVFGGTNSVQGTYSITVSSLAQAEAIATSVSTDTDIASVLDSVSTKMAAAGHSYTAAGDWDFTITNNGVAHNISVKSSSTTGGAPTLEDIRDSINNANAGVSATLALVDSVNKTYRLVLTNNTPGAANTLKFSDPNGLLQTGLGLQLTASTDGVPSVTYSPTNLISNDPSSPNYAGGITQQATDASLTVNGVPMTSTANTITSAISGATITLSTTGTASVTVAQDISVTKKAIQDFVDKYNSLQKLIKDNLSYDADNKQAGPLFGDSLLMGIQAKLRDVVGGNTIVNPTGPYKILYDVGIKTSDRDGTLTFDTAKFDKAMSDHPESVVNMFGAPYSGGTTPTDDLTDTMLVPNLHQGLGNYLHAYLNPLVKFQGTIDQHKTSLDTQIKDLKSQIQDFEDRASDYEERLKIKFASLESLLMNFNSQGTWLSNQLNAMTAKK